MLRPFVSKMRNAVQRESTICDWAKSECFNSIGEWHTPNFLSKRPPRASRVLAFNVAAIVLLHELHVVPPEIGDVL